MNMKMILIEFMTVHSLLGVVLLLVARLCVVFRLSCTGLDGPLKE
jgi:hypothetical protein